MDKIATSGVVVLSGDDKPKTLNCVFSHLLMFGHRSTGSQPVVEMGWVRDVGGPGGVMLRFRADPEILDQLCASAGHLQAQIDALEPTDRQMHVTIRRAPQVAEFSESVGHRLVFRSDHARQSSHGPHFANQRSFERMCTILARSDIDIAQYESMFQEGGTLTRALRLFDYSGRGDSWLLSEIDHAFRASIVVESAVHSVGANTPEDVIAAIRGESNGLDTLHPVNIAYGGGANCPDFDKFIAGCAKQTDRWQSEVGLYGGGYIAVSVHGNDRPGFFVDCLRLLEFIPTRRSACRDVVRSCCRGLGQDGFVLAVAPGFEDEVHAIQSAFDKAAAAEFRRLKLLADRADADLEDAAFGFVYRTIFDPILPNVLVKFIGPQSQALHNTNGWTTKMLTIRNDPNKTYTQKLATLIQKIAAMDGTNINFLDLRVKDRSRHAAGCAIAIEHPPEGRERIEAHLEAAE